jgi:hypothetical protein
MAKRVRSEEEVWKAYLALGRAIRLWPLVAAPLSETELEEAFRAVERALGVVPTPVSEWKEVLQVFLQRMESGPTALSPRQQQRWRMRVAQAQAFLSSQH